MMSRAPLRRGGTRAVWRCTGRRLFTSGDGSKEDELPNLAIGSTAAATVAASATLYLPHRISVLHQNLSAVGHYVESSSAPYLKWLLRSRRGNKRKQQEQPTEEAKQAETGGRGGGGGGGDNERPPRDFWVRPQTVILFASTVGFACWMVWSNRTSHPDKEISWQVFRDTILPTGQVQKVKVITGNKRAAVKVYFPEVGFTYWFTVSSLKNFEAALAEAELALGVKPSESLTVEYDDRLELMDLAPMLGWLLWVGVLLQSARSLGRPDVTALMNTQKDKFKPIIGGKTRFKDVSGMNEAKREIKEFVDFLKYPERFTRLGAKVPSGAILFGPPGTGKTLLAKAVAGESNVPFFSVCGADFVEMYVGVGAARVRELFRSAKQHERAIIYIDEIDAVGRKRGGSLFTGGSSERENTLNQLLVEMDGFKKSEGKIIVLASTNVAPSSLDEALLRPGRLDRQVFIDRPTLKEREEIFETHLNTINLTPSLAYDNQQIIHSTEDMQACDDQKREILGLPSLKPQQPEEEEAPEEEEVGRSPQAAASVVQEAAAAAVKEGEEAPILASRAGTGSTGGPRATGKVVRNPPGRRHRLKRPVEMDGDASEAFNKAIVPNNPEVKQQIAERMAQLSPGFVGADIANICNEGALIAAREKKAFVDIRCMEKAIDRVIGGIEKRSRIMSDFEKRAVAYHEAGHAVVGWFLEHCDPLMKISIVPRGSAALGYAQYLPSEKQMQTYQQLFDSMCMTLGGRASELYHFKHLSTGAQDDLAKVTRLAYTSIATFGMARSKLGSVVSYPAPGTGDTNIMKPYSEDVAKTIDQEVKVLVDKAFDRTMKLMEEKHKEIAAVAEHLLKNEVITRQDFIDLIGPRPFKEEELPPPLPEVPKAAAA